MIIQSFVGCIAKLMRSVRGCSIRRTYWCKHHHNNNWKSLVKAMRAFRGVSAEAIFVNWAEDI